MRTYLSFAKGMRLIRMGKLGETGTVIITIRIVLMGYEVFASKING